MGPTLLIDILSDIRKVEYYEILADEAQDISNKEQVSLCIHWSDSNYTVMKVSLECTKSLGRIQKQFISVSKIYFSEIGGIMVPLTFEKETVV